MIVPVVQMASASRPAVVTSKQCCADIDTCKRIYETLLFDELECRHRAFEYMIFAITIHRTDSSRMGSASLA